MKVKKKMQSDDEEAVYFLCDSNPASQPLSSINTFVLIQPKMIQSFEVLNPAQENFEPQGIKVSEMLPFSGIK